MKLGKYLATLLPSFTQDRLLEDWQTNSTILTDYVLPSYTAAAEHFKTTKFKSSEAKRFEQTYHTVARGNGHDNLIVAIHKQLVQLQKHMEILEGHTESDFQSDIAKDALTYRQANLLQLQEMIGYVLNFSTLVLRYVYVAESANLPDSDTKLAESITPQDADTMQAGFVAFCQALNVLGDPNTDFKKGLETIPDMVIRAESIGAMESTVGRAKLDPFKIGLLPPMFSPIYHARMLVAEWQSNRFHRAKEERDLMQLHLAHLKRLAEGKPDAKLRQEISYYENRVGKYNHDIAEMEKSYAKHA